MTSDTDKILIQRITEYLDDLTYSMITRFESLELDALRYRVEKYINKYYIICYKAKKNRDPTTVEHFENLKNAYRIYFNMLTANINKIILINTHYHNTQTDMIFSIFGIVYN